MLPSIKRDAIRASPNQLNRRRNRHFLPARRPKDELSGDVRMQHSLRGLTSRPFDIDTESPASAQAGYGSIGPRFGQSRQERDFIVLALQQHFGNPGCAAEISIDLKWRMSIEKVRQRRFGEQSGEMVVRKIAFFQSRAEIDNPRAAPSGIPASRLEPPLQRDSLRAGQPRSTSQRDLVSRIQRK